MTDPATTLRNALPVDPANDGPVGVDSTALRQVLNELHTHRLAHHVINGAMAVDLVAPTEDGGA